MGVKLYGAALFLNPNRFFDLKAKPENGRYCQRLRHMFNEVLLHMEPNDDKASLISDWLMTMREVELNTLALILWWGTYGGLAYKLQYLANHIVSLCAPASECERNWSMFQNVPKASTGRLQRSDPLVLEDLEWDNEWVDHNAQPVYEGADITWGQVDEAVGASKGPLRNLRSRGSGSQPGATMHYSRSRVETQVEEEEEVAPEVELEDYSTSEDDQGGNEGEGEDEDDDRGNGDYDDDLCYYDE
ncbi:hypothetical protein ACQ4PT_047689 [Festuca glaucescens]